MIRKVKSATKKELKQWEAELDYMARRKYKKRFMALPLYKRKIVMKANLRMIDREIKAGLRRYG